MNINFTICSNNYLAHAAILGKSLKQFDSPSSFLIFLCDEKNNEIDYTALADEVIPISEIEPQLPQLVLKYNIVELNTSVKPRVFEYLFKERNIDKALYFDPDIKIYHPVSFLFEELEFATIILVPHICTPIPMDKKTPSENHFLNFGIYNLGFIGLKNTAESLMFISWWKEHTYYQGFVDIYKGIFVDQLPITLAPLFFENIKILKHRGLNMAPWNLHERYLNEKNGNYFINGKEELIFFHFSSFKMDVMELPVSQYNRYSLKDRPDLQRIYKEYNDDLKTAGHNFYKNIIYSYSFARKKHLKKMKEKKWLDKLFFKKFFMGKAKK